MNIEELQVKSNTENKNIICPGLYKYFKHEEMGTVNNYIYATMFISEPENEYETILNNLFNTTGVNIITVKLTEDETTITLFEKDGTYYHNPKDCDEKLVIYKSLYDCSRFPCARQLRLFASEVDKSKYPDVKQKYNFELINSEY